MTSTNLTDKVISVLQDSYVSTLSYKLILDGNKTFIEITRLSADLKETQGGPMSFARVLIGPDGSSKFQVYGSEPETQGPLFEDIDIHYQLDLVVDRLKPGWTLCGGISKDEYDNESQNIRYTPQCIERTHPFQSFHSKKCEKWFFCANSRQKRNAYEIPVCSNCSQFLRHIRQLNKKNDISEAEKQARLEPSSTYNWKFLSPTSKTTRLKNSSRKRTYDAAKIARLQKRVGQYQVTLEKEQNTDMMDIVKIINEKYQDEVNSLVEEAEEKSPESGKIIQEIWDQDTRDREDFYQDQYKNS